VGAADLRGLGRADLIVGTDSGTTELRVFDGGALMQYRDFYAFPGLSGGVRVAATNFGPSLQPALLLGAGPGGGSRVRVLDVLSLSELDSFFAISSGFLGGVFVAG
jgi:hypothetical protein